MRLLGIGWMSYRAFVYRLSQKITAWVKRTGIRLMASYSDSVLMNYAT